MSFSSPEGIVFFRKVTSTSWLLHRKGMACCCAAIVAKQSSANEVVGQQSDGRGTRVLVDSIEVKLGGRSAQGPVSDLLSGRDTAVLRHAYY